MKGKHPDPLHSSNAKDVNELTAPEYCYVVSILQLNSLYGYGFITEAEWARGIKRANAYRDRASLNIVPSYYEIRLDNSIFREKS